MSGKKNTQVMNKESLGKDSHNKVQSWWSKVKNVWKAALVATMLWWNPGTGAWIATLWTSAVIATTLTSCEPEEIDVNEAPKLTIDKSNVTWKIWYTLTSWNNELLLDGDVVAHWKDKETGLIDLKEVVINGKTQKLPYIFKESGTNVVNFTITDGWYKTAKAESKSGSVNINIEASNDAPESHVLVDNPEVLVKSVVKYEKNALWLWDTKIVEWKDDKTADLKVKEFNVNGEKVELPYNFNEAGTYNISITVVDEDWKGEPVNITVKINKEWENQAPQISRCEGFSNWWTVRIPWGAKISLEWENSLFIETQGQKKKVLTASDEETSKLTYVHKFNWQAISLPYIAKDSWTYSLEVKDDGSITGEEKKWEVKSAEWKLSFDAKVEVNDVMTWFETWNPSLKVGVETNLLSGLNFKWKLKKVEVTQDGKTTAIQDAEHFVPAKDGNMGVVFYLESEYGSSYSTPSKTVNVAENVLEYNAVQPEKAEIYPNFETANVQAYKRWGIYELCALAKSMQVRDGIKIIIFREWKYVPGNWVYKRIGWNWDWHGEEIYRNISEWTGDDDNIRATKETWYTLKDIVNNSELRNEPIILSSSRELFGENSVEELLNHGQYEALKYLSELDNILIFDAAWNVNNTINYKINQQMSDVDGFKIENFNNWKFCGTSVADPENNNLIPVTYGRFRNKAKFGVYQDQEGRGCTSACAYISKDIFPWWCVEFSNSQCKNKNEERSEWRTSYATPALAAMAKNCFDICRKLWIVNNMTELKKLLMKYSKKIPATRQDIASNGSIIEDVDNGFVLVPDMLSLIENEIFPVIIKKCVSVNGECVVLYKDNGLNIAYQWAGFEYQNDNGDWVDTSGKNIIDYLHKPQRVNKNAQYKKDKIWKGKMYLADQEWKEICSFDCSL